MGLLIGLALLVVVGGIVLMGSSGMAAIGLTAAESSGRKKASENEDAILDEAFDGSPTVSYDTRVYNHLKAPETIRGAMARGYKLVHDDGGNLTFARDINPA